MVCPSNEKHLTGIVLRVNRLMDRLVVKVVVLIPQKRLKRCGRLQPELRRRSSRCTDSIHPHTEPFIDTLSKRILTAAADVLPADIRKRDMVFIVILIYYWMKKESSDQKHEIVYSTFRSLPNPFVVTLNHLFRAKGHHHTHHTHTSLWAERIAIAMAL
jgi:hypothetical protein